MSKIVNGKLPAEYGGVKIVHNYIKPKGKANVVTGVLMKKIKGVVFHETANFAETANAKAHNNYLQNVENADKEYVSYPLVVDDKNVYQNFDVRNVAYHAGTTEGNYYYIGQECCVNKGIDLEKARINAFVIIRLLQKEYGFKDENILPHHYFSGKNCPQSVIPKWDNSKSKTVGMQAWSKFRAEYLAKADKVIDGNKAKPQVTQTDDRKVIGVVEILVDSLNGRAEDRYGSPVKAVFNKWERYKCYEIGNWGYKIGNVWVSKGSQYTRFIKA